MRPIEAQHSKESSVEIIIELEEVGSGREEIEDRSVQR